MKFLKRGGFIDKPTALDSFHKMAEDGNSGSHFCSKALYINLKPKDIYIYTHIKFTAMHKYINFSVCQLIKVRKLMSIVQVLQHFNIIKNKNK